MRRAILPSLPQKHVRALRAATWLALRMAGWNALFIIAGLLLIALVGEAYFRTTKPFIKGWPVSRFVEGVGSIREPSAQRFANWKDDAFVVSRANSLGFIDREPVSAERAAAGCHIAFIGDSFVEAREAPIADKFHVRMEEMAARELPRLGVTTQAYGITNTGQINQFPFYDKYARRLSPKLLVLVFFTNDFVNNSPALQSLLLGADPDRMPFMSAQRDVRGDIKLRPPDPEYKRFLLPRLPSANAWHKSTWKRLVRVSYFAAWINAKIAKITYGDRASLSQVMAWANMIAERPCCASILDDWQPVGRSSLNSGAPFRQEHLSPIYGEALEYTAFGIDQFKRRADRDGAALAILAETNMKTRGHPQFDRLYAIAEARDIPVISQYDYILSQGHDYRDGRLSVSDFHWNAVGHRWAAEAVLEWLKANQDVCD